MSNPFTLTPPEYSLAKTDGTGDGVFGPQYSRSGDSTYFGVGPWQRGDQLTISFAPDGTQILDKQSKLFESFAWMLSGDALESKVLQAFQVWARTTNLNLGRVEDTGADFGISGLRQHDLRFGDIRVGAIDMAPDVFAVAVPSDNLASGTWAGEIIFNSAATFTNSAHFYQVALHEAGHVLGLEHSTDPASPMHPTNGNIKITSADVANLRELYGFRHMDINEEEGETNDIITEATALEFAFGEENGELPSVAFGDVRFNDVDYFKLNVPSDYEGRLTFRIKSEGLSLFQPTMTVFDKQGQLVRYVRSYSTTGDDLGTSIPNVNGDDKFFIRIEGHSPIFGIGTYALAAFFHARTTMWWGEVEQVIDTGLYNREEQDDFWEALLDPDAPLNDDGATNDTFGSATVLRTNEGYLEQSFYNLQGSLSTNTDVDFYQVKTINQGVNGLTHMNVMLDSVGKNGLIPKVEVFDLGMNPIRAAVLINSNGQLSIQAKSIDIDSDYFIKVSANTASQGFVEGNYRLTVKFEDTGISFRRFAAGTLTAAQNVHENTLHVAQSQILHINLLSARNFEVPNAIVWLTIYDEEGKVKFRSATRPGETRSANSVLFTPGSYSVRTELALPDGAALDSAFSYIVRGRETSDPQGPKLLDPTDSPFPQCKPGSPVYCYPNENDSVQPYIFVNETYVPSNPPPTPWVDINQWYWYENWLVPEVPPNL